MMGSVHRFDNAQSDAYRRPGAAVFAQHRAAVVAAFIGHRFTPAG